MKAQVLKIHPIKISRNGNSYQRIEFTMEDGGWGKTDVCPDFLNYNKWKPVIESGIDTKLDGLVWKNEKTKQINADSKVETIK